MIHSFYELEGIVQGVGFRPFIYKLAIKYNLNGYVLNDSQGVKVSIEGNLKNINLFEKALKSSLPPLSRIDLIKKKNIPLENFNEFSIKQSQNKAHKYSLISPDFAMCDNCLNEMNDNKDRRFGYFFTNCTDCGPRYSIIKTVPYDRPNTSMEPFVMCEQCKKEYKDPLNRRYHAQPISCPNCGPQLFLKNMQGQTLANNNEAIKKLANLIKKGHIVALKGMGGFHLICDARNEESIKKLRYKKNRPTKPFALMFKNIQEIKKHCLLNKTEEQRILSNDRPIVIVLKKKKSTISSLIAPNINRLGVFVPYTPLHVKLFEHLDFPIIATSANKSGEPIITNEETLVAKLGFIVEYYLDYNREIVNASDDSVLQIVNKKDLLIRASRGITPISIRINSNEKRKILAVGAHQKNSIAIYMNNQIILSPFIGDLDSIESMDFFLKTINNFKRFYDFTPDLIVCDKHPNYESTKWAKSQNIPVVQVQHHYAHILATMFEKNINVQVLGIAWDGTGYGNDKTIWGGEFFICDRTKYKRVAYFEPFLLLGSDSSIKDIKRIALSIILDCDEDKIYDDFFNSFSNSELSLLKQIHQKQLNSPKCSAIGRLFDAVAVICGVCEKVTYDGESGLILESLYDENIEESYDIYLNKGIIRYKHIFKQMIIDKEPKIIATKFINALINIIITLSKKYNKKTILSGGVFQNKTLLQGLLNKNEHFIFQSNYPMNDGSIAIGQLINTLSKHN